MPECLKLILQRGIARSLEEKISGKSKDSYLKIFSRLGVFRRENKEYLRWKYVLAGLRFVYDKVPNTRAFAAVYEILNEVI
jgi:hypothetical protein